MTFGYGEHLLRCAHCGKVRHSGHWGQVFSLNLIDKFPAQPAHNPFILVMPVIAIRSIFSRYELDFRLGTVDLLVKDDVATVLACTDYYAAAGFGAAGVVVKMVRNGDISQPQPLNSAWGCTIHAASQNC
jgi:hypothetical protein